jgi:hypothetical protein
MIQALLWKEYREHRAVWLTLAVVSAAGMFGLTRLMAPDGLSPDPYVRGSLEAVAVLFAWTYGLVCGSMLLAVERESGTLTFLDMLPARRLELWLVKYLIGLVLFLGQVAVLTAIVIGLDINDSAWDLAATLMMMLVFGLFGMSWGLLFSARGESVLNVIGLAVVGQFLSLFAASILLMPFVGILTHNQPEHPFLAGAFVCLVGIALMVGPAFVSARTFSRTDRLRKRAAKQVRERPVERVVGSWTRLLWLTYSQMRRLLVGLTIFSLAMGFLIPAAGPVAWPILTLLIGVLCGVTVCADEQLHGSFRFLGDQRFPLGRVWLVKVGMRFALALFSAFVLILPSLILTIVHRVESPARSEQQPPFFAEVLHSSLVGPIVPTTLHLTMWLLYGFTAGQLSGLLFRKSLVAAVLALGVAATLASFWVPSLVGIGLHFWQVMGVPAIFLAAAWVLVPAWAADRLLARGTFVSLGTALAAVGLWIAGGLWYRVAEVPDVPDQFDMPAFVAGIPQPEENLAGSKIRGAWGQASQVVRALQNLRTIKPLFPNENVPGMVPPPAVGQPNGAAMSLASQLDEVVERGWPAKSSELGGWMDQDAFKGDWYRMLAEAADQPLGVVENPKDLTLHDSLGKWATAHALSQLLAVRGLQLQARDEPGAFVDNLHIGLSLSRNLQNHAPTFVTHCGHSAEKVWPDALDRWLERLKGHPELLKRVLAILQRHEAELPDQEDPLRAEYLLVLNTLEQQPDVFIGFHHVRRDPNDRLRESEINAAAHLWLIPWEHERHRRIVRVDFQGNDRERFQAAEWGGPILSSFGFRAHVRPRAMREIARLRASQLKVALRLYQAEKGKPADSLDALVPHYLPSIPLDPFNNTPFRYRLSRGERIGWIGVMTDEDAKAMEEGPQPPPLQGGMGMMPAGGMVLLKVAFRRLVPKGHGILWSVGEDGHDDGGKRQGTLDSSTQFGEDILYLVPLPAN